MRIDVIDNFIMPEEVIKYQRKVAELTWNAFERDIYKQNNVLSGMIADLNPDWREEFDDKKSVLTLVATSFTKRITL